MKGRRIAIVTAVVYLFTISVGAQNPQQIIQPTPRARQQLTKALQEYRQKKDRQGEALTLLQLGITEAGLGNVSGARSNLAEAVEKMRAQNDFVGAWLALFFVAQLDVAVGQPADAIPDIERAFAVLNEAKVSTVPFTLKTFVAFGSTSGIPPEMVQLLEDPNAGMLKPVMIQYSFEPMTHDLYGSVLTQVGKLEKAEAELKAAVAGSIYSQGMYDFSIEAHFGDLRLRQQRYDEARTHYVKALNSSTKSAVLVIGEQQIQAGIYDRLVHLEMITGHPEEAKRWSVKAQELARKSPGSR